VPWCSLLLRAPQLLLQGLLLLLQAWLLLQVPLLQALGPRPQPQAQLQQVLLPQGPLLHLLQECSQHRQCRPA
jgi:hypothetical protein